VDFTENPDHRLIREAVRETCARFPDEYWAELDASHTFPWDFYQAMAEGGWIGIAIPAELGGGGGGITEASIVLEEVAASGACWGAAARRWRRTGRLSYRSRRPPPGPASPRFPSAR